MAVHAKPFEGGGLAAEGLGEPDLDDGLVVQRGALVDDQVGVRRGGPAVAPVSQPLDKDIAGSGVQRTIVSSPDSAGPRTGERSNADFDCQ